MAIAVGMVARGKLSANAGSVATPGTTGMGAGAGASVGAGVVADTSSDNAANIVTPNNAAPTPEPVYHSSAQFAPDYVGLKKEAVDYIDAVLKKTVFGQNAALGAVNHHLRKWDMASLLVLFLDGSTQVGKTLLAAALRKGLIEANVSVESGTLMVSLKQGMLTNITNHIARALDAAAATGTVAYIHFDEVQDLKTEEEIHAALPFFARLLHPTAPYVEDSEGVRHNASRAIIVVSGHLSSDAVQNLWSQVEKDYGKNAAVLVEQLGLQMDRLRERTFKPWSSVMPMGRDPQQYMQFITLHPFGASELRSIVVPMVQQRLNTSATAASASSLQVMNADLTMRRAFVDIVGDGAMSLVLPHNVTDFLVSTDSVTYPAKPLGCATHTSLLKEAGYNPPRCAVSQEGAVAVKNVVASMLECAGINDEAMAAHIRTYLLGSMVNDQKTRLNHNSVEFSTVAVHRMHITWALHLVEPVKHEYSLKLTALVKVDEWLVDGKVVGGGAEEDTKTFTIATNMKHLKAAVGPGGCSATFADGIRRLAAHRR